MTPLWRQARALALQESRVLRLYARTGRNPRVAPLRLDELFTKETK